ncbi:hypothetical protein RFI_06318 [Reticulomyxa filosa]|uniref:Uncharacterized protein n=1 Tax=Reticulomyxa filosa TaxID=46433 RepID=X6NZS6_RETFI|nr:hypothetical protein RFI_06318 [Reticulomyxa filosa]|eukprot:ETO30802.1 hypothetical protein RFI_06318 [Reticulomyxa filosa]
MNSDEESDVEKSIHSNPVSENIKQENDSTLPKNIYTTNNKRTLSEAQLSDTQQKQRVVSNTAYHPNVYSHGYHYSCHQVNKCQSTHPYGCSYPYPPQSIPSIPPIVSPAFDKSKQVKQLQQPQQTNKVLYLNGVPEEIFRNDNNSSSMKAQKGYMANNEVINELPPSKFGSQWKEPPKITAMNLSTNIGMTLNLHELSRKLPNVFFNPKDMVVIRIQIRNPNVIGNIFTTGTITVIGVKSSIIGIVAIRKIVAKIRKCIKVELDIKSVVKKVTIAGLSGTAKLAHGIDLKGLERGCPDNADLDPEMYSAEYLRYIHSTYTKGSAHIFKNGAIHILGVQGILELKEYFDDLFSSV